MNNEQTIRILKLALKTILFESKEPHTKMYARNALDETTPYVDPDSLPDAFCTTHKWFGQHGERCPICKKNQVIS